MTGIGADDLLQVNCGRCSKPLIALIADIKEQRTITCDACKKKLPAAAVAIYLFAAEPVADAAAIILWKRMSLRRFSNSGSPRISFSA